MTLLRSVSDRRTAGVELGSLLGPERFASGGVVIIVEAEASKRSTLIGDERH